MNELFGRVVPLALHTNFKCLYDSVSSLNSMKEERFYWFFYIPRQSHRVRKLTEISRISSAQKTPNTIPEQYLSNARASLIRANEGNIHAKTWIKQWIEGKSIRLARASSQTILPRLLLFVLFFSWRTITAEQYKYAPVSGIALPDGPKLCILVVSHEKHILFKCGFDLKPWCALA